MGRTTRRALVVAIVAVAALARPVRAEFLTGAVDYDRQTHRYVYTYTLDNRTGQGAINEPAAYGGYGALKAVGKDKGVTIVAVDGGCNGVKMVKNGIIGGDSQQYPLLMAADGVQQVVDFIKNGKKPTSIDSGEKLITDHPVPGVPSITTDEAAKLCWG